MTNFFISTFKVLETIFENKIYFKSNREIIKKIVMILEERLIKKAINEIIFLCTFKNIIS